MVIAPETLDCDVAALSFTQAESEKLWHLFCPVAESLAGISAATLGFLPVSDGDDVVQETFIAFACGAVRGTLKCLDGRQIANIADGDLDRYVDRCRAYLIRSIIHKCGEFHRKTKTRLEVIGPWLDNVSEREGDPVFAFIQQEQVRDVQNAITHLPKHLREVVMLRFYAQYSEKEIAANLGVSVRTVRNRFHKVQEQLRILLSLETFHGPTVRTKIRKRLV